MINKELLMLLMLTPVEYLGKLEKNANSYSINIKEGGQNKLLNIVSCW